MGVHIGCPIGRTTGPQGKSFPSMEASQSRIHQGIKVLQGLRDRDVQRLKIIQGRTLLKNSPCLHKAYKGVP